MLAQTSRSQREGPHIAEGFSALAPGPARPPGRELERKVPGDAVASAALAGVVVFITQIYSEPRRLAPSPDTVGGRDGSYKPRFGSINSMGGQNCLPSSGNRTGSPPLYKLSRESNTSTANQYRLAGSAGTIPSCGLGRKVPREHMSKGTRLLERVERLLGPADQLDYVIRRTVIPSAREPLRGVSRSTPRGKASLWNSERLREVQEAIGRCLRAQYDLAQPIPARLVELLRQLDNETASPEGTTRDGYASRA